MKILLVYYHPIIWDLAQTLLELGNEVEVAVNPNIKDNYGTGLDIIKKWSKQFTVRPLQAALALIKAKKYDLVGCDGVFDGDSLVIEVCKSKDVPFFCIDGYPNTTDEPADNILTFGWALPTLQYNNQFPSEYHKKEVDWQHIAFDGESPIKNFCVFYPNMWYMHQPYSANGIQEKKLISGIQRFEECNKWNYAVFEKIKTKLRRWDIQNLEKCSHEHFLKELQKSEGLLHLKWADKPGISVLESMWLGRPIVTLRSFVLSSFNQDLLIDDYTAIIADDIDELVDRVNEKYYLSDLGYCVQDHVRMLCSFERQKDKLQRFLNGCVY